MDFLTLLIIIYAIKSAIEDTRSGWRTSKAAYMRSADARFPDAPKSRRAARALQHDTGYWTAQALRGFPGARRGFTAGWREGRQAQAEGKPVPRRPRSLRRPAPGNDIDGTCLYCGAGDGKECKPDCPYGQMNWREVDRIKRERAERADREGTGEGSPEAAAPKPAGPYYSWGPAAAKSGWPADDPDYARRRASHMSTDGKPWVVHQYPPGGGPGKVIAIYLDGREVINGGHRCPRCQWPTLNEDICEVCKVKQEIAEEGSRCDAGEAERHERCNAPGCACPCHATTEAPAAGAGRQLGSQPERHAITEGNPSMAVAADTTYDGMLTSLAAAKNVAEGHAAEIRQASQQASQQAEQMQALEVDSITLGAMADHLDARAAAVDAQNRVLETAELVELALKRGHARLNEAHQDAPVTAADKSFYAG